MSEKEKWLSVKSIIIIVFAAVFAQVMSTVYNAKVIQAETVRNTEEVQILKSDSKNFVIKIDNELDHTRIYSLIQANEDKDEIRNQKVIESIDANQKFIIERIDNVNNNILKLHIANKP
jgi:hypothetical protein